MSGRTVRAGGQGFLWLGVLLLVAGVGAGLWLSFVPAPGLFQVRAKSSADVRQMQMEAAATQPSALRVTTINGDQAWQELAKQIGQTSAGASKSLLPRLNTELGENDYYFAATQTPMSQIPGHTQPGATPVYVRVDPRDARSEYLEVTYLPRGVGIGHAPGELAYPMRPYALWCFVAGIAAFVLLPHSYGRLARPSHAPPQSPCVFMKM